MFIFYYLCIEQICEQLSNFLKYSQFAKALGVDQGNISMARRRGHIICDTEKKHIDIDLEINRNWISKQEIEFGRKLDLNKIFETKPKKNRQTTYASSPTIDNTNTPPIGSIDSDVIDLTRRKLEADVLLKERNADLKRIEIEKKSGELIPFYEANSLLKYIVEEIRSGFLHEAESIANIYKERFNISQIEYIEIKSDIRELINTNVNRSKTQMINSLDNIQNEYIEVRGRGESK